MNFIKTMWQTDKEFRRHIWNLFNGIISTIITAATYYGTKNATFLAMRPVLQMLLNMFTKRANLKRFNDLGTIDTTKQEIVNTVLNPDQTQPG